MSTKLKGNLLLLLAAFIWGSAFVAQRVATDIVQPFTFNAIRMLIGGLVLLPVIRLLSERQTRVPDAAAAPARTAEQKRAERRLLLIGGCCCGLALFAGTTLQQYGVQTTTAGKAGFITALYMVLVPVIGGFLGRRTRPLVWVCVAIAAIGLYLLCITDDFTIGRGDLLVLLSALFFTAHILVVAHFSPLINGVKLSCVQFFVCGGVSLLLMLLFDEWSWRAIWDCRWAIGYAGILSCGVAYTLQVVAQGYTDPTLAALLLSLESVFAVLSGMAILNELMTPKETLGCVLMFAAVVMAQLPEKNGLPPQKAAETPPDA
ncbi:MAG: DMT family transporter [Bacillota bacterium]|nr:DMT family transporter [Bacillota bacterium]